MLIEQDNRNPNRGKRLEDPGRREFIRKAVIGTGALMTTGSLVDIFYYTLPTIDKVADIEKSLYGVTQHEAYRRGFGATGSRIIKDILVGGLGISLVDSLLEKSQSEEEKVNQSK